MQWKLVKFYPSPCTKPSGSRGWGVPAIDRFPLADLGLLAKPTRLAIVPWLLVFFIDAVSLSRCSAARRVAARDAGTAGASSLAHRLSFVAAHESGFGTARQFAARHHGARAAPVLFTGFENAQSQRRPEKP